MSCSNGQNCQACAPGYGLLLDRCYLPCPTGYFFNGTACAGNLCAFADIMLCRSAGVSVDHSQHVSKTVMSVLMDNTVKHVPPALACLQMSATRPARLATVCLALSMPSALVLYLKGSLVIWQYVRLPPMGRCTALLPRLLQKTRRLWQPSLRRCWWASRCWPCWAAWSGGGGSASTTR